MSVNITHAMTVGQKTAAATLETCLMLCMEAHYGQRDRNGLPYCLHPIRVSNNVTTIRAKSLALIHDSIEDGPEFFVERLSKLLPYDIVQSCLLLSRVEGESYHNYIERIATQGGVDEILVKLADLKDNSDISRMDENARKMSIERYHPAYDRLIEALRSKGAAHIPIV